MALVAVTSTNASNLERADVTAPDAELIEIGLKLDRLIPAVTAAYDEADRIRREVTYPDLPDRGYAPHLPGETDKARNARCVKREIDSGYEAAVDRAEALSNKVWALGNRAILIRAKTLAGFTVKARLAAFEQPLENLHDDGHEYAAGLLRDLLAGTQQEG